MCIYMCMCVCIYTHIYVLGLSKSVPFLHMCIVVICIRISLSELFIIAKEEWRYPIYLWVCEGFNKYDNLNYEILDKS